MPGKKGSAGIHLVDAHPQRKQIIDLILAGKPVRYIASQIRPPLSHGAIQRYKQKVIKPMLDRASESARIRGFGQYMNAKSPTGPVSTRKMAEIDAAARTEAVEATRIAANTPVELLTQREGRIAAQQERHRRLAMIVEERARDMADETPGGASGFLTRDYRSGPDGLQRVYKFDAPLAQALLDHEKAIAIETGQWQENAPASMSIQIICPSVDPDPARQPRISYASPDQITAAAPQVNEDDDVIEMGIIQLR